jgi:hypothetical protein
MRRGTVSVVAPFESTLPGVVTKEPNADGGKRLEDVPFGGGLEARIGRPTVGLDAQAPSSALNATDTTAGP